MFNTIYNVRFSRSGFTLVEILIVVAILGILAAITIPAFQGHVLEAKESAAKANLQILRNVIGVYAAQHDGTPPGYTNGDTSVEPTWPLFLGQMLKATNKSGQIADPGTEGFPFGPYISNMASNPFNNSKTTKMIINTENLPDEATGTFGWIYKPITKEIRLDWPGINEDGMQYYDY